MKYKKTRRKSREEKIQVIYRFELFDEVINISQSFVEFDFLDPSQLKFLEGIEKNYVFIKKIINSFLNTDWTWHRIPPFIRAVLINATAELFAIPPKIVINEAVEITKDFFCMTEKDQKFYKFVNAILQNVYKSIVALESSTMQVTKNDDN
ncbi:transcription antitermination protein NusB [Mycoplasmopsis alligatoris]|uniref:Transcription antitermination factor NusB n=1 Tax=Mycoplasmopsis alligatoris A21JP2 TaxID=747682 RepID=D4XW16_9BACT|nr:transcription antitermination protein NusB [Mycoplasmopsis alligatoris]EFF41472.1 transcription antitermination factor NusB [Mycoplasmopsis alligatoris A21JP2]